MSYIKVCQTSDVPEGASLRIEHPAEALAVHHLEGEFYVTQDRCTHDDWSLSEGYLQDGMIECTLHWAKFCVKTGQVKAPPACQALKVYPVRISGTNVEVDVEAGRLT
ncbi:bifunctional 3-phenylpropionate/cinnamic acid dioxygenase ferredoxin subunit [Sphingomonas sp. MG17]|uniref:Bifunctional 3-phenylpropionate/cinnamic acid dioxygenase ferredoxin subunit n=1 Tax=Sphingomonas tagetis TaxID=2949092 RepID=A0A9X2KNR8_9SPHN|nr:bifunctional 3-phenylpropionate/cinnamic acid dioxygenase ferredoxin subunit [Sphingomonas tagetis]